jgi:hypothetical protein
MPSIAPVRSTRRVLDATDDEATPSYQTDDGREVPHVTREKRPDVRANRHAKKVEVTVFGSKVWIVWEATTQIPLALGIDGINVADNEHALAVLQQAKDNVTKHATLRSVALDRGFLFVGESFGIMKNWELMLLVGVSVRERDLMGESVETVLRRYGVELPDPGP